jgi:hypothetical protein
MVGKELIFFCETIQKELQLLAKIDSNIHSNTYPYLLDSSRLLGSEISPSALICSGDDLGLLRIVHNNRETSSAQVSGSSVHRDVRRVRSSRRFSCGVILLICLCLVFFLYERFFF